MSSPLGRFGRTVGSRAAQRDDRALYPYPRAGGRCRSLVLTGMSASHNARAGRAVPDSSRYLLTTGQPSSQDTLQGTSIDQWESEHGRKPVWHRLAEVEVLVRLRFMALPMLLGRWSRNGRGTSHKGITPSTQSLPTFAFQPKSQVEPGPNRSLLRRPQAVISFPQSRGCHLPAPRHSH